MKGMWEQMDTHFMKPYVVDQREFVIHTGVEGMRFFDHTLQVIALTMTLDQKKNITHQQRERIQGMIDSPDLENLEMARLILEQI